jgi:hypothetical protein
MNKKGLEFSFTWIFAIIAGAAILFLAIFAASRIIKGSEFEVTTVTAKELSIIFEPLETGIASGKSLKASLSSETRIYNDCYETGVFGEQRISMSVKKRKTWGRRGAEIPINNKYIFSPSPAEGKDVYIFGMPLELPFKIADIIVLTTRDYCLINAPDQIREDLENLNLENIYFDTNCSSVSTRVCFGGGSGSKGCNVFVYGTCNFDCESEYDVGYVNTGKENIYFAGNLIYPAIFSDAEVYECNAKRLMKKALQLALLYKDEAQFISSKCDTVSSVELGGFAQELSNYEKSRDLVVINSLGKSMEGQFKECELW